MVKINITHSHLDRLVGGGQLGEDNISDIWTFYNMYAEKNLKS